MSFANNLVNVGIGALVATKSTYAITNRILPYRTLNQDGNPTLEGVITHAAVAIGLAGLWYKTFPPKQIRLQWEPNQFVPTAPVNLQSRNCVAFCDKNKDQFTDYDECLTICRSI